MENVYQVNNLTFLYGKRKIIDDVSFSIKKGDIVGLLGPNGAGKSTLVNLLTGVLGNYTGDIYFGQSPVRGNELEVKSNVSAILDRSATYDSISVERNLVYYCKLLDVPVSRGDGLLDEFELTSYKKHKVRQLSSGFRQRLRIVIALLNNPSVIFLDEPWIALDPVNSHFLTEKITELNQNRGITFMIAAHDLNELERLCSRFLFIKSGRLLLNFPRAAGGAGVDVVFVKDGAIGQNKPSDLQCFADPKEGQAILISPSEDEMIRIRSTDRRNLSLKDLYFKVLT